MSLKAERLFDPNFRGLGQPLGPAVLAFHLEMTIFILLSSAAQLPSWFQGTYAQAHQTPWAKFKIPHRILSQKIRLDLIIYAESSGTFSVAANC